MLSSGGLVAGGVLPGAMAANAADTGAAAAADTEGCTANFPTETLEADVVVAGGGMAGVCAALSAARNGARVILIQNRSRLGGNASSEIRMHVCGANNPGPLRLWRETGIIEELKLTESAENLQRSFEIWDFILYNKVISQENLSLMLDTSVVNASVEGDQITSVTAVSALLESCYKITAKFFIDCTGDATLAMLAGAEYMRGREAKAQWGESLAPDKADNQTMGNSLLFMSKEHDREMPFTPPPWAKKFTKEDLKHRGTGRWEYGYWWIEWGGELDTIADNRKIRRELMAILMGIWDYIKNSGEHPKSKNWALEWVSMIPGKRESRRITGDHVMIQKELESAEVYPDRVSYGGWPMDDHPPGGIYRTDEHPCQQIGFKQPYHVPLRSLYSKNRPNLLMAGRNISASHVAFSSSRVMATCAAMGQAAGAAAAWCVEKGGVPRTIVAQAEQLRAFQQRLLRDDQSLIGVRNEDAADLARQAKVSASAEEKEGPAASVIDGWNRDIGDGAPHQWRASMQGATPWLMLEWPAPQAIGEIQLSFDSGLNRMLMLSGEDPVYNRQTRGVQPELVADYRIEARIGGAWKPVAEGKNNIVRMVRHGLEGVEADAVRIKVERTNGDTFARIFEVRCYA